MPSSESPQSAGPPGGDSTGRPDSARTAAQAEGHRLADRGLPVDMDAGLRAEIERAGELRGLHKRLEALNELEAKTSRTVELLGARPSALAVCRVHVEHAKVRQEQAPLLDALGRPEDGKAALEATEASLKAALRAVDTETLRMDAPAYVAEAHARLGLLLASTDRRAEANKNLAAADSLFGAVGGKLGARRAYALREHYGHQEVDLLLKQGRSEEALALLEHLRKAGPPLAEQEPGFGRARFAVALQTRTDWRGRDPTEVAGDIAKGYHDLRRDAEAGATWLWMAGHQLRQGENAATYAAASVSLHYATSFAELSGNDYLLGLTEWTEAVVAASPTGEPRSRSADTAMRWQMLGAYDRLDGTGLPEAAKLAAELRSDEPSTPDLESDVVSAVTPHPDRW